MEPENQEKITYDHKCRLCEQALQEENVFNINLNIEHTGESIRSKRVIEFCKYCLDTNDLKVFLSDGSIKYKIENILKYDELKQQRLFNSIGGRENYCTVTEAIKLLKDCYNIDISSRTLRSLICGKKQSKLAKMILKSFKYNCVHNGDLWFLKKEELHTYAKYSLRGIFVSNNDHKISEERINELKNKEWVVEYEGRLQFFDDRKNGLRVCKCCGEIKNINEFRKNSSTCKANGQGHYRCMVCESNETKQKYANLTDEEKRIKIEEVKLWAKNNRNRVRELGRKYDKKPKRKFFKNIRKRLKDIIKKDKNTGRYRKDVGCTRQELIRHIESQFQEGMSWDNYGQGENNDHQNCWHIDHIIPISKYEGEYPNHYTNLQPMWGIDNIKKGNRLE